MPNAAAHSLEGDVPSADLEQDSFDEALHDRIRLSAYYRSLQRGSTPGNEEADWYAAEAEEKAQNSDKRPV